MTEMERMQEMLLDSYDYCDVCEFMCQSMKRCLDKFRRANIRHPAVEELRITCEFFEMTLDNLALEQAERKKKAMVEDGTFPETLFHPHP